MLIKLSLWMVLLIMFGEPSCLAVANPDPVQSLTEANRLLMQANESLLRANESLKLAGSMNAAILETKASADKASAGSKVNRDLITASKAELAVQAHNQTVTIIWWNVAVLVSLLTIAVALVYHDHNRVQSYQAKQNKEMYLALLEEIKKSALSSLLESQKATDSRAVIAENLKEATAASNKQVDISNHINDKIILVKQETERKIDKIEQTTDSSHSILEEMKERQK